MAGRRTMEDWKKIHDEVQVAAKEGKSAKEFLQSRGIHYPTYYSAVMRFRKNGKKGKPGPAKKYATKIGDKPQNGNAGFVKLFDSLSNEGVRIQLSSGAVITIAKGDTESLRAVLLVTGDCK